MTESRQNNNTYLSALALRAHHFPRTACCLSCIVTVGILFAGCGRDHAPQPEDGLRLVSTAPNLTECVCAIGAADLLVGRTDVCDTPQATVRDIPVTGGFGTPWLEPLLAARPTHLLETVLADPSVREHLTALRIPVVHVPCSRLSEIPSALRQLGRLTHHMAQADALAASIQSGFDEAHAGLVTNALRPRTLMLFDPDTPITAGRDAFVASLLELAGGVNLGRDVSADYYHVSLEWIVQQDPDLLLCLFAMGDRSPRTFFENQTGWKALRAVCTGRVYTVPDLNTVSRPGPRVLDGLAQLKAVLARDHSLHPDHAIPTLKSDPTP